jgi:serine/threonine protein kinase
MRASNVIASIDEFCRLLRRSRLLAPEEIDSLLGRWRGEAADPGNLVEFSRWLVAGRLLTDYQVATLLAGHADHFFLAGYKLLEKVGRGKQTSVYRGVDRVGRLAALKVLPPSRARDAQALARFHREGRLGQRLHHANVVHLLGAGEEDGLNYIVMEYLEGETLDYVLASRGRLPPAEAVEVALQALAGLAHLHERGLVHRNVEPANLMVVRAAEPTVPLVKVLDLGLSRAPGEEPPPQRPSSRPVHDREMLAAAAYLAPEMALDPEAGDIRSDVYSLGCVLYHALAGQPPFSDPNPLRQALRHATETPRPLRDLAPDLPEDLPLVVAGMMARQPGERFAGAAQAAEALRAVLSRGSVVTVEVEPVAPFVPPPPPPPPVEVPATVDVELVLPASFEPVPDALADFAPLRPRARVEREAGLDRRDWLMLLAGASVLLVVQTVAWLLGRLASAWRRPSREADEGGEEE